MALGSVALSHSLLLLRLITCVGFARADNPIVQDIYTADPAPLVHDGRVYVFTGHDEDNSTWYTMRDWRLFSSADMVNWQHHGSPMDLTTFSWADNDAWAGQVVARNDKFYFYAPVHHSTTSAMAIGVGISDSITGPYTDALGYPLVENGEIDPTVYIDDDGQAYLYWGNPGLWYVELNEDMISYSGNISQVELTGPWLYKREDIYYMIYAATCCSENIRYSTGSSPTGPWTYRGIIMQSQEFTYNADGTIPELSMTTAGPAQIGTLDPYRRQEAETIAWSDGIEVEACSEGGFNVANIDNGDYIKVGGVAFDEGASSFTARVASAGNGGNLELHLDSKDGPVVAHNYKCSRHSKDSYLNRERSA
ncbi:glycosyl hydrolase [Aspergillus tetrazonus]